MFCSFLFLFLKCLQLALKLTILKKNHVCFERTGQLRKFQFEFSMVESPALLWFIFTSESKQCYLLCSNADSILSLIQTEKHTAIILPSLPCPAPTRLPMRSRTMHGWLPSPLAVEGQGRCLCKIEILEEKLLVTQKAKPSALHVGPD